MGYDKESRDGRCRHYPEVRPILKWIYKPPEGKFMQEIIYGMFSSGNDHDEV